jgi:hypothetical protein
MNDFWGPLFGFLFIFWPFILLVGALVWLVYYAIKNKKGPAPKRKDLINERSIKEKEETITNVACTDCGKLCDAAQMKKFQKYSLHSHTLGLVISRGDYVWTENVYWEEVIAGKKRKHSLSDKLPEAKVLCPSCADRFRREIKEKERKRTIIGIIVIIILIIIGIIIYAYFTH